MQDDVTTQQRAVDRVRVPAPIVVALGVVAMVPMLILRFKLHGVDDPDAFWHVLSGQNVWATRQVVTTDPFGDFTTNQWIQIDWLSDLVMAAAYGAGGLAGVAWLYAVLDVVLFVALYAACRVRAGILVSAIAAFVGWFGTYASLAQRPQTISFILLAVTIGAWSRTLRRGTAKPPWWLVPLTWVWACLHGLWFLGPLIGFTVVVGLALDRRHDRTLLLRLGAVPALSVLAACLTPVGPRLLLMPITVNAYGHLVSEWQPPDIHQPNVAATILLVAVIPVVWARSQARVSWVEILLWGSALGWSLLYARTVAVAAVIAAPLVAYRLSRAVKDRSPQPRRLEAVVVSGSVLLSALLALVLAGPTASAPQGMPTDLARQLDALPDDTVVFNDDMVGGWLLLEHPELRPVMDTRTYLYTLGYVEDYIRIRQRMSGWEDILSSTQATSALLPIGDSLAGELTGHRGWVETARGSEYLLLRAPEPSAG